MKLFFVHISIGFNSIDKVINTIEIPTILKLAQDAHLGKVLNKYLPPFAYGLFIYHNIASIMYLIFLLVYEFIKLLTSLRVLFETARKIRNSHLSIVFNASHSFTHMSTSHNNSHTLNFTFKSIS